jgi:hypothetical protein
MFCLHSLYKSQITTIWVLVMSFRRIEDIGFKFNLSRILDALLLLQKYNLFKYPDWQFIREYITFNIRWITRIVKS